MRDKCNDCSEDKDTCGVVYITECLTVKEDSVAQNRMFDFSSRVTAKMVMDNDICRACHINHVCCPFNPMDPMDLCLGIKHLYPQYREYKPDWKNNKLVQALKNTEKKADR